MKTRTLSAIGALLICIAFTPTAARRETWDAELRQATALRKKGGPDTSLQYLNSLPASLRPGQRTTVEAEYKRLRAMAHNEDLLSRWPDANRHLEQCVHFTQISGRRDLAANSYAAQFSILIKLRRLDDAADALERSRAINNPKLAPYLLHDQGSLLEFRGHFEEAIVPLQESLHLFEVTKQPSQAANVRISLAWAYLSLGQYGQAAEQYEAGGAEADVEDKHLYLGHLGDVAYWRHDFAKAADLYHAAAERAKDSNQFYYAGWLTNESAALLEFDDVSNAVLRNRLASLATEKIAFPDLIAHVLLNEARILAKQGKLDAAVAQLEKVAPMRQDAANAIDTYSELAQVHLLRRDYRAAQDAYRTGVGLVNRQQVELLDEGNQISFAASGERLNQRYIAGLVHRGRIQDALEAAECSRAGLLRRNLSLSQQKYDSPRAAAYREAAQRSSSAYLVYWVAPEQSYLWAITGSSVSWFALPGEIELSDRVNRFQALVQERGDAEAVGAELFKTLIGPARKQLGGVKNVVVVPDGPLYRVNFETLRQGTPEAPYWIENFTVSAAPSLALLLAPSRPESAGRRILMVGDAVEWNASFPRLLNSKAELNALSTSFPAVSQKVLTQAAATPGAYEKEKLTEYRFIHFATHALGNANAPLESAIVLSLADGRGLLKARDILKRPVNAEVISLSACHSAGVTAYSGEGLVGLAWAFLHSGAHSVVAAIWDVNDYSSPLLMTGLYSGLNRGQSATEALRMAKLKLLKPGGKYAHPYYWGEFVLYRGAGALDDGRLIARR